MSDGIPCMWMRGGTSKGLYFDRADLPETLRSTFVLRDIQGLSGAETAEVLGVTVQAVKNRLHRARLRLRDRLSQYFVERTGSAQAAA